MAPAEGRPAGAVAVQVAYCPAPGQIDLTPLALPVPATVGDALRASGVLERHALDPDAVRVGIWGRAAALDAAVRDGDRIEIYRPLRVDPKEARRLRYQRHRAAARR